MVAVAGEATKHHAGHASSWPRRRRDRVRWEPGGGCVVHGPVPVLVVDLHRRFSGARSTRLDGDRTFFSSRTLGAHGAMLEQRHPPPREADGVCLGGESRAATETSTPRSTGSTTRRAGPASGRWPEGPAAPPPCRRCSPPPAAELGPPRPPARGGPSSAAGGRRTPSTRWWGCSRPLGQRPEAGPARLVVEPVERGDEVSVRAGTDLRPRQSAHPASRRLEVVSAPASPHARPVSMTGTSVQFRPVVSTGLPADLRWRSTTRTGTGP